MPVIVITKSYIGQDALTKQQLDASFGSITDFVNTTKLDSNNIQAGGISGDNFANSTITSRELGVGSVTSAQIASSAVTGSVISPNINLSGTAVRESNFNLLVNSSTASVSLSIIRGYVSSSGAVVSYGEGFASSRAGVGVYTLSFTTAFSDVPSCFLREVTGGFSPVFTLTPSSSGCSVITRGSLNQPADSEFDFMAIGKRS